MSRTSGRAASPATSLAWNLFPAAIPAPRAWGCRGILILLIRYIITILLLIVLIQLVLPIFPHILPSVNNSLHAKSSPNVLSFCVRARVDDGGGA